MNRRGDSASKRKKLELTDLCPACGVKVADHDCTGLLECLRALDRRLAHL